MISSRSRSAALPALQKLGDRLRELRVVDVAHREVDRDGHAQPCELPRTRLPDRFRQHRAGQPFDEAGALREWDEFIGADEATLRMHPAYERFDARDRAGTQVDLRLVIEDELSLVDGPPQIGHESKTPDAVALLVRGENRESGERSLRRVHRDVRSREQLFRLRRVSGCHRDADGRADVERLAVERERLLERGEDLLPDARAAPVSSVPEAGSRTRRRPAARPYPPRAGSRGVAARPGAGGCRRHRVRGCRSLP